MGVGVLVGVCVGVGVSVGVLVLVGVNVGVGVGAITLKYMNSLSAAYPSLESLLITTKRALFNE